MNTKENMKDMCKGINECFAMNGSWMTRDSVHFSQGWFQDIFRDFLKKNRSQYSLIYLHKQFDFYEVIILRGYDHVENGVIG